MIQIALDYPPSANRIWRRSGGRMHMSEQYRAWRDDAAWTVKAAVLAQGGRIDGPYQLFIDVGRPDKRRRDLDNLIKPLSDALALGGAVKDDSFSTHIQARWVDDLKGVKITVTPDNGQP